MKKPAMIWIDEATDIPYERFALIPHRDNQKLVWISTERHQDYLRKYLEDQVRAGEVGGGA